MASFNNVEVIKTNENYYFIEWEFVPDSGHLESEYEFTILWSTDPDSGYQNILDEFEAPVIIPPNQNYFTHQLKQYQFNIDRYYKIVSTAQFAPNNVDESSYTYVGDNSDGPLSLILRNEQIRLNQYCGEPGHLIKRHTFGVKCPNCYDEYRDSSDIGHCPVCYGSKFLYGWYQPINIQIDTAADPNKSDSQKTGEDTYDNMLFRITNYPLVRPGDLVILTGTNQRYEITHVDKTKLPMRSVGNPLSPGSGTLRLSQQNYVISQIITVKEWASSDNPYELNIFGIPEIPNPDQPGGGYVPPQLFTALPPLLYEGSVLSFMYDDNDFGITNDGVFFIRNSTGTDLSFVMPAGENIADLFRAVVAINGGLFLADYSDPTHFNRLAGINLLIGNTGEDVTVIFGGNLYYENWAWDETKKIFFDENGVLTQDVQPSGFYQYVGIPVNSTTIRVDIGRCVHRV